MMEKYPESFTTGSINHGDCIQACGDMSELCKRQQGQNCINWRVSRTDFQWTWGRKTIWCNLACHHFLSLRLYSLGASSILAGMSFKIKVVSSQPEPMAHQQQRPDDAIGRNLSFLVRFTHFALRAHFPSEVSINCEIWVLLLYILEPLQVSRWITHLSPYNIKWGSVLHKHISLIY